MKLKSILLAAMSLFVIHSVDAQEQKSLQDCLSLGIENNYSLRISRQRQQISDNNFSLGNAGFLPTINLNGSHSGSYNNLNQNYNNGETNELRGILNTGTNAGVNLNWSIFNGFRVQATYQKLSEMQAMGELNTRVSLENLVSNIASEYFNLVQQKRLLLNMKYAVDLSKERARIDQERFLLGSGSKMQLLQAQVYLNADSSRLGRQYEVVRASRIRLNEYLAMEQLEDFFSLADTSVVLLPFLDYETLLEATLAANASLELYRRQIEIAQVDRKITISRSYPYVNLSSGYGYTHNTYQSGTLQNQQSWGMNYGITVGMTLFDGFNRRREISNSIIQEDISRLQLQEVEQMILSDLLTIYRAYENNFRLLNLELQNLEIARENLDIAMDRYKLGALAGIELREVQKSLLDAEERLLSIQYQTKLAEISLLKIAGKVLDYL